MTWMYHADLVGGLAGFLAGGIPVAWNIRHSDLRPGVDKSRTLFIARICALLSRHLPKCIVCCAHSAGEIHSSLGCDGKRMLIIPNGFDPEEFHPDFSARSLIRTELAIAPEQLVIGMVARFHHSGGF